jgi:hypothetical protein
MTDDATGEAAQGRAPVEPPALPARLRDPRPVILVITVAWLVALIAAFAVPSLQTWRPITVAGLGLAALGTGIFLWQRHAARTGARGAQTGLE